MSDFQQRLEAELLAAAQRPVRLRLARLPAIERAGGAAVGAVMVLIVVAVVAFAVAVRPDERSGRATAGRAATTAAEAAVRPIPGRNLRLPSVLNPRASTTLAARGDRLTVVVFTASWCGPCNDQASRLRALVRRGVPVLLVSSLEPAADARRAARSLLRGAGHMVQDPGRRLGRAFGVHAYPEAVLIEGGAIRSRHPGRIGARFMREVERLGG